MTDLIHDRTNLHRLSGDALIAWGNPLSAHYEKYLDRLEKVRDGLGKKPKSERAIWARRLLSEEIDRIAEHQKAIPDVDREPARSALQHFRQCAAEVEAAADVDGLVRARAAFELAGRALHKAETELRAALIAASLPLDFKIPLDRLYAQAVDDADQIARAAVRDLVQYTVGYCNDAVDFATRFGKTSEPDLMLLSVAVEPRVTQQVTRGDDLGVVLCAAAFAIRWEHFAKRQGLPFTAVKLNDLVSHLRGGSAEC